MVIHVLDKARAEFENVFVATDDQRIAKLVENNGGKAIMTGIHHKSGTERCAEALENLPQEIDHETIIINLQGDEPFIPSGLIVQLAEVFGKPEIEIATLIHPISKEKDIQNPNRVKVVKDKNNKALYFSRSVIPHPGNSDQKSDNCWYQHIGVYAFRMRVLKEIVKLSPGILEVQESLEQLRWLENGYNIHCLETDYDGFGIDTPEDLDEAASIT